jgi:hypothetical protein
MLISQVISLNSQAEMLYNVLLAVALNDHLYKFSVHLIINYGPFVLWESIVLDFIFEQKFVIHTDCWFIYW